MPPTPSQPEKTRHEINSRKMVCGMGCSELYLAGGRKGAVNIEQDEFIDWSVGEGFGGHS